MAASDTAPDSEGLAEQAKDISISVVLLFVAVSIVLWVTDN